MTQQGLNNLFSDNINILEAGVPISGHPLFTLIAVTKIWADSLNDEEREEFMNLTVRQIMDDPSLLITKSHCTNLPSETQALISCTNMVLAQKVK